MVQLNCKNDGRYLGEAESIVADLLCPGCRGTTQFKILKTDQSKLFNYKFAQPEREPKKKDSVTDAATAENIAEKAISNEDADALKPEVS